MYIFIFICVTKSVADPGFSRVGCANSQIGIILQFFAENCMKMKEFGPPGEGARVPGAPLRSAKGSVLVKIQSIII